MAGRKKSGGLTDSTVSVRLDAVIEHQVREIAMSSAVTDSVGEVVRTLVTAWFMERKRPLDEYEATAIAVNKWRRNYAVGVEDELREIDRGRRMRRKDRAAGGARSA